MPGWVGHVRDEMPNAECRLCRTPLRLSTQDNLAAVRGQVEQTKGVLQQASLSHAVVLHFRPRNLWPRLDLTAAGRPLTWPRLPLVPVEYRSSDQQRRIDRNPGAKNWANVPGIGTVLRAIQAGEAENVPKGSQGAFCSGCIALQPRATACIS
jgi:hypothetical protein